MTTTNHSTNGPSLIGTGLAGCATLALTIGYLTFESSLPRGPAEFVTWPPLEPLPFAPLRGFTYEQLARHVGRLVLLTPACCLLSIFLFRVFGNRLRLPSGNRLRNLTIATVCLSITWSVVVALVATGGRALLDDELVYRQQAELLLDQRLAESQVPPWTWEPFTIATDLGLTGKYLFGEPLIQMVGVALGYPGLLHFPLLLLTLIVWHTQVKALLGRSEAHWSTFFLGLSPMILFTTATGLPQPTSMACVAVAGLGATWIVTKRHEIAGAVMLATSLGFGITVRPQSVAPIGFVLCCWAIGALLRRRHFGSVALIVLFSGPWIVSVAVYNQLLTGSPTRLPWSLFRPLESFGFGTPLEGDSFVHTPLTAVENLLVMAIRFNGWWLGWPAGAAVAVIWLFWGRRFGAAKVWGYAGVALVAFHIPYFSTGVSETGPIYLYELSLPLSLIAALTLRPIASRWPAHTAAALVAHLLLGTLTFSAEHIARLKREVTIVHGPVESMIATITPPALLLYELAPQESVRLGWMAGGFPKRWRQADAPIVTYPRGDATTARALMGYFSDRSCWYYRVEPTRIRPEILRCETVSHLIDRPLELDGPAIAIRSTAMRMGLLEP